LILLSRAWSKLDVQVVVCNWFGDSFKAWVAGSNPAALTSNHEGFSEFGDFGRMLRGRTANRRESQYRTCYMLVESAVNHLELMLLGTEG
jgi:hypothetical protein